MDRIIEHVHKGYMPGIVKDFQKDVAMYGYSGGMLRAIVVTNFGNAHGGRYGSPIIMLEMCVQEKPVVIDIFTFYFDRQQIIPLWGGWAPLPVQALRHYRADFGIAFDS